MIIISIETTTIWLNLVHRYRKDWCIHSILWRYSRSLDVMLQWLKEAIQVLPSKYADLLLFCTLTGMRGSECVESVRLLLSEQHFTSDKYYNPERQILQHYLYPQIFIRGTKAIYISIVNDEIIGIAKNIAETPPHPKRPKKGNCP